MVFSEGLTNVDPWCFNVDSWLLTNSFSHDNDLLARALHNTVTAPHNLSPSSTFFDSTAVTDLSSDVSGRSDPEIVSGVAKRKRNCLLQVSGSEGKAAKRRSQNSKKSRTTFITADPSNFLQMVQQVTGAKSSSEIYDPVIKPEPNRLANRLVIESSQRSTTVPTLDTSAFLSNDHQEHLVVGNNFSGNSGLGLQSTKSNTTVDGGGSAVEYDTYSTFPTLESCNSF